MKGNWKKRLIAIAIPLGVGTLASLLTRGSMADFEMMAKPPLSPPGWLFPVAWTILYVLMGIASYLVYTSDAPEKEKRMALILYGAQLLANFLWPILFFGFEWYFVAFLWILFLWALIVLTMLRFYRISSKAGDLLLPYLLWVTFAAYLNYGIWILN
jgi:tryptophan-rich sensory protein